MAALRLRKESILDSARSETGIDSARSEIAGDLPGGKTGIDRTGRETGIDFARSEIAGDPAGGEIRIDPARTALLMIDMEKAFVEPGAALCIRGAKATVPDCAKAADAARRAGVPVIWLKRIYRADGSDMEIPRRRDLAARGYYGVLAPDSTGINSIEEPDGLCREPDETVIIKPRYSAFFRTGLDQLLRAGGIDTVLLAGTTTPNCIRTTCYDAISLDYRCILLEPCCSSQTEDIQTANMDDMERAGAEILRGSVFPELKETVNESAP